MNQQQMQCNISRSYCGIDEDSNELISNSYKSWVFCYSIGARLVFAKYKQHSVEVVIMSEPSRKTQDFVLHAGQS